MSTRRRLAAERGMASLAAAVAAPPPVAAAAALAAAALVALALAAHTLAARALAALWPVRVASLAAALCHCHPRRSRRRPRHRRPRRRRPCRRRPRHRRPRRSCRCRSCHRASITGAATGLANVKGATAAACRRVMVLRGVSRATLIGSQAIWDPISPIFHWGQCRGCGLHAVVHVLSVGRAAIEI